jgi:hypothetical protein
MISNAKNTAILAQINRFTFIAHTSFLFLKHTLPLTYHFNYCNYFIQIHIGERNSLDSMCGSPPVADDL